MNLIEAIKSGKRFRRTNRTWHNAITEDYELVEQVSREDLLADDWEVEQKAVPITQQQFWDAFAKATKHFIDQPNDTPQICSFIAKELGL